MRGGAAYGIDYRDFACSERGSQRYLSGGRREVAGCSGSGSSSVLQRLVVLESLRRHRRLQTPTDPILGAAAPHESSTLVVVVDEVVVSVSHAWTDFHSLWHGTVPPTVEIILHVESWTLHSIFAPPYFRPRSLTLGNSSRESP